MCKCHDSVSGPKRALCRSAGGPSGKLGLGAQAYRVQRGHVEEVVHSLAHRTDKPPCSFGHMESHALTFQPPMQLCTVPDTLKSHMVAQNPTNTGLSPALMLAEDSWAQRASGASQRPLLGTSSANSLHCPWAAEWISAEGQHSLFSVPTPLPVIDHGVNKVVRNMLLCQRHQEFSPHLMRNQVKNDKNRYRPLSMK